MITVTLNESDALTMLSEIQVRIAQAIDSATRACGRGDCETWKIMSQRAECLDRLASTFQTAIFLQRGELRRNEPATGTL